MTHELLYLSAADIDALGLSPAEVFDAVDAILRVRRLVGGDALRDDLPGKNLRQRVAVHVFGHGQTE